MTFVTEYVPECYASTNFPPRTNFWTLDSASTVHIAQNPEFFTEMKNSPPGSIVKMGTSPHIVKGIGTAKFTVREGPKLQNICLQNVLYVPTIQRNLISMAKMDQAGIHAKLDKGFKIFSDRWKYLWTARLKDNFYVIKGTPVKNNITMQNSQNNRFINNLKERKLYKMNEEHFEAFAIDNDIMKWHERMAQFY